MNHPDPLRFDARPVSRGVVLILHPSSEARTLVADAARRENATFASCCDADACLQQLAGEGPRCVVADLASLAGGSDGERPGLVARIRRSGADAPVVAVLPPGTGVIEARSLGAWVTLPEPPPREQLTRAVREALTESSRRQADRRLIATVRSCVDQLSQDERRVMEAVCEGKLNKQIAREFGVSIRTVEQRRRRVFAKMDVSSAVPLAAKMATVETIERLKPELRVDRFAPIDAVAAPGRRATLGSATDR